MHDDDMADALNTFTPAELGRELGHDDGARPGITVRRYLRERYPGRPKGQRWILTQEEAADVRRHFGSARASKSPDATRQSTTAARQEQPESLDARTLADDALRSLRGARWTMTDAADHLPNQPGLYAIYGDVVAWADLGLRFIGDSPLYVGKAEDSLASRDLNGHFAIDPPRAPSTGHSTVRRSLAALLRRELGLRAVPRNLSNPGHYAMYGLADGGDARLTAWMHQRLTLAVWPRPRDATVPLARVETKVIEALAPPLNLSKNPGKLARLSQARAEMAAEAARWSPTP